MPGQKLVVQLAFAGRSGFAVVLGRVGRVPVAEFVVSRRWGYERPTGLASVRRPSIAVMMSASVDGDGWPWDVKPFIRGSRVRAWRVLAHTR